MGATHLHEDSNANIIIKDNVMSNTYNMQEAAKYMH